MSSLVVGRDGRLVWVQSGEGRKTKCSDFPNKAHSFFGFYDTHNFQSVWLSFTVANTYKTFSNSLNIKKGQTKIVSLKWVFGFWYLKDMWMYVPSSVQMTVVTKPAEPFFDCFSKQSINSSILKSSWNRVSLSVEKSDKTK